ncbi:MAG: hypothetical protein CVU13_07775 [Bacteroidetes bacterium HGW-Bacteroidetes-8]|jgi:RNA polymerase sigma-70 factor (ECF subfamily)|nr:MAG: hypothetical protein CVU13_07775 [Bacteroidetes bacterium HGW-Bacteroidetes-8]
MSEKLNEKQLLLLISKGNQVAFHEIYERYKDKIYSFAMYLTHTDYLAEEITQEVFINIWATRERLALVESFKSYLVVIAKNVASNHLKRYAFERIVAGKLAQKALLTETTIEEREEEDAILKIHEEAIKTLSVQQQRVYILHHIKGVKNKEIAELLGISLYTVKEYLKIASRTVRDYVSKKIDLMIILALNVFFN